MLLAVVVHASDVPRIYYNGKSISYSWILINRAQLYINRLRNSKIQSSRYERVFDDNSYYFSLKSYVVTPCVNRLNETVQMRGHNKCVYAELTKIILNIIKCSLLSRALKIH